MRHQTVFIVAALAAGLAVCPLDAGQQISLVSSKDNTLYADELGEISNGAGQHMFVGLSGPFLVNVRRSVLAFDVASALPAGAIITSVELRLHQSMTISGDISLSLHRLLADWGEGASNADDPEGPGTLAEVGDATWLHTFYSDSYWTNPGGDFDPTISASTIVGSELQHYSWSSAGMVADVQSWVDNPGANFGWILMGGEELAQSAKRFDTREHEQIDVRPTLIITYVPAPGAIALLGLGLLAPRRRRH